ncbi:1,3-beta-glucanase [Bosea sp. Tri-44]|uniref:1,3-beta-glucanase n=1 Tax=Bosea sp. Tri-44 TaxID=1972137 RepID=UPI00100E134C|nr:1,3-beta-glucanase [Bosea sp. Tri-44]RXT51182.1 1,3-beta-glucanase [Bosea sp. Tri-44]
MPTMPSRRTLLRAAAALATAAGARSTSADAQQDAPDPTLDRTLIFDESFASLDPAIWQAGPKATTHEPGFYGRSAFSRRGGEEGFDPYAIVADPLASGGHALAISARYLGRPMNVPAYYGNALPEFQWISGNLQTARRDGTILRGWRNGYFEARMRFPAHPLSFPAFWLMNGRSILFPATSVEIDIVEHKGWEHRLYGAYLHEWGQPGERHEGVGVPTEVDLTSGYFRYGGLIDGDRCVLYFERKPIRDPRTGRALDWRIGRASELDSQGDVFWPLITLALRSDVPFPRPLRPEDREAQLRVDYVRVYGS